jgi:hypothetical protein
MGLSNELISQFAKITKDEPKPSEGTTVNGTAVAYEGKIYVRIDGSDQLTPVISSTAGMKNGDRVTVLIKNHTATVTGNTSSPSAGKDDIDEVNGKLDDISDEIAEFEIIIADKVSTDELEAEKARIDDLVTDNVTIKEKLTATEADIGKLEADNVIIKDKLTANEADIETLKTTKLDADVADIKYATIENLEATNADIHNLKADYGNFKDLSTGKFSAIDADIKNLDTEKLSAKDADIKYANIDFANIGKAAIENFFSKSGMIGDLVVGDGTITGTLIGVTIKGDLIEGGTVKADKLVIKGSDGLYYKLNTNGEKVETQQTDQNSLNGSIITAKSITATKISVSDLVAFDATIGGFKITDSSLYSGAKSSAGNTTRGIFLGDDGELAVGDGSNFLKYFKDTDGKYKLQISAASIKFGASSKDIQDAITDGVKDEVGNIQIGGRNLTTGTAEMKIGSSSIQEGNKTGVWRISVSNVEDGTIENIDLDSPPVQGITRGIRITKLVADKAVGVLQNNATIEKDQPYTISFWVKSSVPDMQIASRAWSNTGENITNSPLHWFNTTGEWQYIKYTENTIIDTTSYIADIAYITITSSSVNEVNSYIDICAVKMEKGTVATAWSPAPEDNSDGLGGKNIFRGTENPILTTSPAEAIWENGKFLISSGGDGVGSVVVVEDSPVPTVTSAIAITGNTTGTRDIFQWLKHLVSDQMYTLSFWVKGTGRIYGRLGKHDAKGDAWTHENWICIDDVNCKTWEKRSYTFSTTNATPYNRVAQFGVNGACEEMLFLAPKLELGNTATDWSQAPEDVDKDIDNARSTADDAKSTADSTANRVTVTEASIETLSDSISMLVTDKNGNSLMTQTGDGWTFNMGSINDSLNNAVNELDKLSGSVDGIDKTIDNLNSLINDVTKKTAYIIMTTDDSGNPCIELGKEGNQFRLRITNTAVDFMDGTSKIAYVNNKSLYIEKAIIKDELQIGEGNGFVWKRRGNGNMGLRWVGG